MMNEAMTLSRTRPETCLSDLVLDRLAAGELDASEAGTAARAHLEGCAICLARSEALAGDAASFRDQIFVTGLAHKAERAARKSPLRWAGPIAAIAAAFGAIVLFKVPGTPGDEIRRKGGLGLGIVARHLDGRTEEILPGAALRPGEAIRFEVSSGGAGHLMIAGVDAAKNVTTYYNGAGEAGIARLLDGSVTLDATLGPERIFAVLCESPVDEPKFLAEAKQALDRAGGDPSRVEQLQSGCLESSFLIEKVEAR